MIFEDKDNNIEIKFNEYYKMKRSRIFGIVREKIVVIP